MKSFFKLREETTQVTVGDYTTKHFDMCPSAVKLYSKIKDMTVMVHLIVENMMLHDVFFRLEKQAVAQGAIDEDDLEKAQEYADLIMDNAKQMGLEKEHSYIEDVHMARFEKLAGMSSEEDMNEKTLTPAELKKREEVAKAIKRENPNMPMAKKMAIATATAKKVAEAFLTRPAEVKAGEKVAKTTDGDEPLKKAFLTRAAEVRYHAQIAKTKKVTEGVEDMASMGNRTLARIAGTIGHPQSAAAKNELARRRMQNEERVISGGYRDQDGKYHPPKTASSIAKARAAARRAQKAEWDAEDNKILDRAAKMRAKEQRESTNLYSIQHMSSAKLKFHATNNMPHGSYSNKQIKAEHDRRMRTEPDYAKTKASLANTMPVKEELKPTDHKAERLDLINKAAAAGLTVAQRKAMRAAADLHGKAMTDMRYADAARKATKALGTVKESTSTDKLKILARAGLVDQKNVERLIAAFKMLEAGKVLSTQQKDLILSSYSELASIVTGDSMTFQKAKKAVAEAVELGD